MRKSLTKSLAVYRKAKAKLYSCAFVAGLKTDVVTQLTSRTIKCRLTL